MSLNNKPFSIKKLLYNFSLSLLTGGASLILGFLSFSGMFALYPVFGLAVAAFGLSVAYEGEIYLQNIKGALKKLLKNDYLKNYLAREYLLNNFPDTNDEQCPQFFRDYKIQLELLKSFGHKNLDEESKQRKKIIEKTLSDMEKWFAQQLFRNKTANSNDSSAYAKQLHLWLDLREGKKESSEIKNPQKNRKKTKGLHLNLAKEYLSNHFPDTTEEDCPQFFQDYKMQLELLKELENIELDEIKTHRKRAIEKKILGMQKWFARQVYRRKASDLEESEYAKQLQRWLAKQDKENQDKKLENRGIYYKIALGFSVLAGLFMGLGSTYLIVEAFTVIPFIAVIPFTFWPLIIIPMALIAGAAYGLLTYNAVTDMINNNTIIKWFQKIRDNLKKGLTVRSILMAITAVILVGLAIAITICTAGTWWTVATNARPLFEWMTKLPNFIMGVINPIITGLSAVFFNIQNTAESLDMIDEESKKETNIFQRTWNSIVEGWKHLRRTENWFQIFNPFRLLLKLTVTPLRALLFLGHLFSIALTADRMPGVPQWLSMLFAIIGEGFEDGHYFADLGHSHDHGHEHGDGECHGHHHNDNEEFKELLKERLGSNAGHSHENDIPTYLLKLLATPLYALAALWDCTFSQLNTPIPAEANANPAEQPRVLNFKEAWNKQTGVPKEEKVELAQDVQRPSSAWQSEHALARITKFQDKVAGHVDTKPEVIRLNQLKEKIRHPLPGETLPKILEKAKGYNVDNIHGLFAEGPYKSCAQEFIEEELPERMGIMVGG